MGPTLRERRREELVGLIEAAARRQLSETGAAGLSLRAVAREVGIAVSALYRYYPSRDELLTELLVSAFDEQADAVEQASGPLRADDPTAAIRAAYIEYRDWSRAHPAEFGLMYGAPVPGYAAPGQRTIHAGTRVGDFLIALLTDAWDRGCIDANTVAARESTLTPAFAEPLRALAQRRQYDIPLPLLAMSIDTFVRVHGAVSMEVFGQLRPITPDADGMFHELLDRELSHLRAPRP